MDGCWEWPKSRNIQTGYGQMGHYENGKHFTFTAHRVSLALTKDQPEDSSICALHTCDNRGCFNPSHLFWGSQKVNMLDMHSKGRQQDYVANAARGEKHGSKTSNKVPKGSAHKSSKLNEDAVQTIRSSNNTLSELGQMFGVTASNICAIKKGKTWKHV